MQVNEKVLPTDNGVCTVLNLNESGIFKDMTQKNHLYASTRIFANATDSLQMIKGASARRGLLLQIMGPRHRQTQGEGTFFRNFIVSQKVTLNK